MSTIVQMLRKARALLLRRGASPDDAEDIVQEAFARMEAYSKLYEVRSQEAFLVNAAFNIARDQARKRRNAPFAVGLVDVEIVADTAPVPDEAFLSQERLRRAAAGLQMLKPKARSMLLAHRLDGMTYAQIAAREGLSAAAVEKQIARAVVFLVKWVGEW